MSKIHYVAYLERQNSLQIDESTLTGNDALVLAYVRFIQAEKLVEEMLFARPLVSNSSGESIVKVVGYFFLEKEITWSNTIPCATVGRSTKLDPHTQCQDY